MGQFVSTALTALGYPRPSFNDNVLLFKKISDRATTPSRESDLAAGYDLYSAENVVIPKQGKALVKTDIAIALPEGCYGRVAPRYGRKLRFLRAKIGKLASRNLVLLGNEILYTFLQNFQLVHPRN